jgi:hypothetical protein
MLLYQFPYFMILKQINFRRYSTQRIKRRVRLVNIFDWLLEISYNKRDWNEFTAEQQASFDPYMIHRFISMKQDYIEIVNEVQYVPIPTPLLIRFMVSSFT